MKSMQVHVDKTVWFNASGFLYLLPAYRVCWVKGRYGGGKSLLAFAAAQWLCEHQDFRYIVSNMRSVWSDSVDDVRLSEVVEQSGEVVVTADAVIVLDEAGLFARFADDASKFMAFLRKLNLIVLAPSVASVSMLFRAFTVERFTDLSWAGIPVWIYEYRVQGDKPEKFALMNYKSVYGVYSTVNAPSDDAGLAVWLKETVNYVRKRQAAFGVGVERMREVEAVADYWRDEVSSGASSGEISSVGFGSLQSSISELQEVSEVVSDAVSAYAKLVAKSRKR